MPANFSADDLPLQRIYKWERERPESIFLTQPHGGGKVRDWTWGQAVAEIRRIAAWLKAQDWEPGSRVAILSRNCAWWRWWRMARTCCSARALAATARARRRWRMT